jgi:soluble lytic murein transglycosylase-like protein
MNEDSPSAAAGAPPLRVYVEQGAAARRTHQFDAPFRIGREQSCDVCLADPGVSRYHAEFWHAEGSWWVLDLDSANGTYLNGVKVDRARLSGPSRLQLGLNGPVLEVAAEEPPALEATVLEQLSLTQYVDHYVKGPEDPYADPHTSMIRRAIRRTQRRQRLIFSLVVLVLVAALAATLALMRFRRDEAAKQADLAREIFYGMKSLEVQFLPLLEAVRSSADHNLIDQVRQYRVQHKEMEKRYADFLSRIDAGEAKLPREEQLVRRVARSFGECEVAVPKPFVAEVLAYVTKWRSTSRLREALGRARAFRYTEHILDTLRAHDLPDELFYLALQESDFDRHAVGPETAHGIAKGLWQFLPSTASYYGLRVGPLEKERRADLQDERHDFEKSTAAAARYLRDLYGSQAQGSGILVMASYNWGESRVSRLIQRLPQNPRERNFWRLLSLYRQLIPQETYDYIFHILSAAVIGEDPRHFGFDFDSPLPRHKPVS